LLEKVLKGQERVVKDIEIVNLLPMVFDVGIGDAFVEVCSVPQEEPREQFVVLSGVELTILDEIHGGMIVGGPERVGVG
jgi:hypothetical protein